MVENNRLLEFEECYYPADILSEDGADFKTYIAYLNFDEDNDEETTLHPVVCKELDEKRVEIYRTLTHMWNPHRSNIFAVYQLKDNYTAVCEYIDGVTLTKYSSDNNTILYPEALRICIQICDALHDIHKVGFVHKDLSPNNIMIDKDMNSYLIDFGISTKISSSTGGDTEMMGTEGFAAPEVIGITKTDARADIYSIGCILNYLFTKKSPREGVLVDNPVIRKIVLKATSEDRRDRYQSVQELKKAILQAQNNNIYNKVPFLKNIPGFRRQNMLHSFVAIVICIYLIRSIVLGIWNNNLIEYMEFNFFLVVFPAAVIFGFINPFRFLPHRLRTNSGLVVFIKTILVISSWVISYAMIRVR